MTRATSGPWSPRPVEMFLLARVLIQFLLVLSLVIELRTYLLFHLTLMLCHVTSL